MSLKNCRVGVALTGSFCTISIIYAEIKKIIEAGADVTPLISFSIGRIDTRYGRAEDVYLKLLELTGKEPIDTLEKAEPVGPKALLDILLVAPCTGNTLARLATGITDTPVTMACKAHLRNNRPIVLAISTNDGLGGNAKNLGLLLNAKNIFFVPFGQDDPIKKCNSLTAKMELIVPALEEALQGRQLQPLLIH